jgi:hypothetical protein
VIWWRWLRYRHRMQGLLGSAAGVLLVVASTAAYGQTSAALTVHLDLESCPDMSHREVRRAFQAEIGARLTDELGPLVTTASAACEESRVTLSVMDPITRKAVRRTIDLGAGVPHGRERLVALAMTELLVATWAELEANPLPRVQPEGPAPPAELTQAARMVVRERSPLRPAEQSEPEHASSASGHNPAGLPNSAEVPPSEPPRPPKEFDLSRERNFRILVMGSTRAFFDKGGALWGGGLRVGEERFRIVSWALDSLVESGRLDQYAVDSASFGGTVAFFWRTRRVTARLGAGVRLGMIRSNPAADSVHSDVGFWGWPLLATSFTVFPPLLAIELNCEAGYAILPLSSGVTTVQNAGVRGSWFGAQVGFGFLP